MVLLIINLVFVPLDLDKIVNNIGYDLNKQNF